MEGEVELVYEYEASFHDITVLDPNNYNMKSFDTFLKDFFDEYNEKKHPFMAEITLPVLDPTTGKYCIGFIKSGVPLEEYAHAERTNFYDMHLIKEPYQSIIIDLLYLTRHLSEQNFEANLDGNIMVSTATGSRTPMILLVDLGTIAVGKQKKSLWEQLATFMEKINAIISYNPGPNTEMDNFIRYLNVGCRAPSTKECHNYLASLSLFWTQRGGSLRPLGHDQEENWRTVVEKEPSWLVRADGDGGFDPVMPFKNI